VSSGRIPASIRIGIASSDRHGAARGADDLLAAAGEALQRAKNQRPTPSIHPLSANA
jgi:hypothetical protein